MGFGSYDESEQQNQEVSTDEDDTEAVTVGENGHEGEVTLELGASTENLVADLQEMKETDEDDT